ncbi:MAG: hypothetical protein NTY51_04285 [Deltaproteobacteria bacterium]|nr:hypothetical protein [Deltaproteobacteria bacterium]
MNKLLRICFATLLLFALTSACLFEFLNAQSGTSTTNPWKTTSVRICKTSSGALSPSIEAIGTYPVYTFFIPRPIWTVNGVVVEAVPIYQHGRLVAFELLNSSPLLNSGAKNTVKFALPDHNGVRVFFFDSTKFGPGECYEFF